MTNVIDLEKEKEKQEKINKTEIFGYDSENLHLIVNEPFNGGRYAGRVSTDFKRRNEMNEDLQKKIKEIEEVAKLEEVLTPEEWKKQWCTIRLAQKAMDIINELKKTK